MLEAGAQAPEFTLPDLDGKAVTLAELHQDRPALLVFFKASCPICQMTLPFLNRLREKLTVVTISQDDARATQRFRARFGVTVPALLDDEKGGYRISNAYRISNVPSLFLVEPDGVISRALSGFSKADMEAIAERVGATIFEAGEAVPAFRPG